MKRVITALLVDDLKSWRTVGTGVLARLEYMGHSINQNTIGCGLQGSGYLRISTPDGTAATIKGVDAIRNHTDTVATLAPQQVSGGSALLVPAPPRQVVEWKKWALWGILSLVLLLVLWMAKGLLSELKQE